MIANGNKQLVVVAFIAGLASIGGAFVGAWSGREVATMRMDAIEKTVSTNAETVKKIAEQVQALVGEVGRVQAIAAATKAVQDERTRRFQALEAEQEARRGKR
jgi:hypothetical protein